MKKLGIKDLDVRGKRILLRVDFNVPIEKQGKISDDSRIVASLPTIQYLLDQGASLVLMSHLGRPSGIDPSLSLEPCSTRLSSLLGKEVLMAPDCVGPSVEKIVNELEIGEIVMLENLRFHPEEEEPERDPGFVSALAEFGDAYVNDAFGSAHRAHASTAMLAKLFPGKAAAGFLMEKELEALTPLLQDPPKPFHAIVGGAKISSKAGVIHHLLGAVDALYIGGAMAIPFLKAKGIETGASSVQDSDIIDAKELLLKAKVLYLPLDVVIADSFKENAEIKIVSTKEGVPKGWQIMDIGPQTISHWSDSLKKAQTVFWNGPLGVFEMPPFAKGTRAIAEFLANSSSKVTVGGGDSIAAICQMGLKDRFTHLSTGGGASLEFLEYGHLPGVDALSNF